MILGILAIEVDCGSRVSYDHSGESRRKNSDRLRLERLSRPYRAEVLLNRQSLGTLFWSHARLCRTAIRPALRRTRTFRIAF